MMHLFRLIKKMVGRLEQSANLLSAHKLLAVINSIRVTLDDRRLTIVFFDGEDWCYRWFGGSLYLGSPKFCPKIKISQDIPIFSQHYQPAIGHTVVDGGAGVGTELPWLSKAVGKSGRVIAVEADPTAARRLRKMVATSKFANVAVVEKALWSENVTLSWNQSPDEGLRSAVQPSQGSAIQVEGITLASLCTLQSIDKIDFVKLNIEGAERQVFESLDLNIIEVSNWCVSCHDFMGPETATWADIQAWFELNHYKILDNRRSHLSDCEAYYQYATLVEAEELHL